MENRAKVPKLNYEELRRRNEKSGAEIYNSVCL